MPPSDCLPALYGVVVGITRRNPKVVLAYSSVSQLGVMVAVIGMGMIAGDGRAALATAFYATNHILVKGALFLSVGVIAATGQEYLWLTLLPTALIAVGLGGLPLTGGGLAKLVVDGPLGDGTASMLATVSAVGTTVLMLQFLRSLLNNVSPDPDAKAAAGLVMPWLAVAAASIIMPWTLYLAIPKRLTRLRRRWSGKRSGRFCWAPRWRSRCGSGPAGQRACLKERS